MTPGASKPMGMTQFVLLLHCTPQLGEKVLTRVLRLMAQSRLGPEECLNQTAAEWRRRFDLRASTAAYLAENVPALRAKSAELARLTRSHALSVLTITGAAYPVCLESFEDVPPPILYALGRQDHLARSPEVRFTFALATSNDASGASLDLQDALADRLMDAGGAPVTGHDRLPYQRLALAAQRRNRPIVYVFDRGLREALGPDFDRPPFAAARIRDAVFMPERDLALSPFRLDDHGLGANNRQRDRLIVSLADVLVVVDVRAGGNLAAECRRAQQCGRTVYVADGGRDGNRSLREAGAARLPDAWDDLNTQQTVVS